MQAEAYMMHIGPCVHSSFDRKQRVLAAASLKGLLSSLQAYSATYMLHAHFGFQFKCECRHISERMQARELRLPAQSDREEALHPACAAAA